MVFPTIDGDSIPTPPAEPWAEADIPIRFEDVTQDGRLLVTSLLPGLGATAWRGLMQQPYAKRLLGTGVVPILTRLVATGVGGPFGVGAAIHARGTYGFSHVRSDNGEVERIHLNMWIEASLPLGATYGAPPEHAGEMRSAGTVFAEHTVTRPFGPPEERRVRRLDVEGLEPVPGSEVPGVTPQSAAQAPPGATFLDAEPVLDPAPIAFGLAHTDSNQHVNSLVYIRLFEEAALRRLAAHGRGGARLVRHVRIGYRKPCFAGDQARIVVRAFEHEGVLGAVGAVVPAQVTDAGDTTRAHAFVACTFG